MQGVHVTFADRRLTCRCISNYAHLALQAGGFSRNGGAQLLLHDVFKWLALLRLLPGLWAAMLAHLEGRVFTWKRSLPMKTSPEVQTGWP